MAQGSDSVGTVRLAQASDKTSSVTLFAETFGKGPLQKARRAKLYELLWEWKFQRNPESESSAPTLLVYERDGKILGQRGMMPFYLLLRGQTILASWGVDFAVDPNYQRQGIGTRLLQRWFCETPVCAALGSVPASVAIYRKLGLVEIGPVLYMIKLLRPLSSIWRAAGMRRKLVLLRGWTAAKSQRDCGAHSNLDVEQDIPQDSWDRQIENMCLSYDFIARRNVSWLRWRFVEHPLHGYVFLAAKRSQRLCGYVALRTGVAYGGLPTAIIGDVLFAANEPDVGMRLITSSIELARVSGLHAVVARASHEAVVRVLRQAGFFAKRSPVSFFINLADVVSREAVSDLAMASKWHITMADSDAEANVPSEV
jgi:GNAT superfamily N-acetyltransferase